MTYKAKTALFALGILSTLNANTLDECVSAYKAGALDKAETLCSKAVKENPKSFGTNFFLAKTYIDRGEYKKMLPFAQKLEKLAKTSDEYRHAYQLLGICYSSLGDKKEQLKYNQKELDIAMKSGNGENIASAQINIGAYYQNMEEYDKAISYYSEATKNATDKDTMATAYGNIGSVYYSQKKYNESNEMRQKALKLAEEAGKYLEVAYHSIGIGGTYTKLKDYENGEKYIRAGLEVIKREGVKDVEAYGLRSLGWLEYEKGNLQVAKKYALDALSLAKSVSYMVEIEEAEYLLEQIKARESK